MFILQEEPRNDVQIKCCLRWFYCTWWIAMITSKQHMDHHLNQTTASERDGLPTTMEMAKRQHCSAVWQHCWQALQVVSSVAPSPFPVGKTSHKFLHQANMPISPFTKSCKPRHIIRQSLWHAASLVISCKDIPVVSSSWRKLTAGLKVFVALLPSHLSILHDFWCTHHVADTVDGSEIRLTS